jgi:hypothetical protein
MLPFTMGSCNDTFEPLQENDRYVFSMYGSLDVHADTQWVRIMPIGKTLLPETVDNARAEVELTRLSTGESVSFKDSVFIFGGTTTVLNYWTTERIFPNETYRLKATDVNGLSSQAVVTTPQEQPVPFISYDDVIEQGFIEGLVTDSIVSVVVVYHVQVTTNFGCTPEEIVTIPHTADVYYYENVYRMSFRDRGAISNRLGIQTGQLQINHREGIVVTAKDTWPRLLDLSAEEMVLPDLVSNVDGGTGYVAGIARRRFAFKERGPEC